MAYLTERERYELEIYLKEKYSVKQIAEKMNRHISTIYREIKRGTVEMIDSDLKPYKKYCADTAQNKYNENKLNKGVPLKIGNDLELANYIEKKIIKEKYSPQAVLYDIKNNNLNFKTTLCFKTIYNYIDKGIFLTLSNVHLPCRRNRKKHPRKPRICARNADKRSIEENPRRSKKQGKIRLLGDGYRIFRTGHKAMPSCSYGTHDTSGNHYPHARPYRRIYGKRIKQAGTALWRSFPRNFQNCFRR